MKKECKLNSTKTLIDKLNIVNFADESTPLSENDIRLIHLQLAVAKIILGDAKTIKAQYPERDLSEIIQELLQTWKANIHDFALALSEER